MKFIWRRVILLFILGAIALSFSMPIHELGHAIFAIAFGGKIVEISWFFPAYCGWRGLSASQTNIGISWRDNFFIINRNYSIGFVI